MVVALALAYLAFAVLLRVLLDYQYDERNAHVNNDDDDEMNALCVDDHVNEIQILTPDLKE